MSEAPHASAGNGAVSFRASRSHLARMQARGAELADQLSRFLPPSGEFVWEIGCGHGHFLTAYALAHPGQLCVGVDITSDRIERANRKRDREQLPNLHFLRADARLFLEVLPSKARIGDVFVLFPDPWPKLRHHKHRVIQPDFLAQVAAKMGEGGRLFFRTDYEPYFAQALGMIMDHPLWLVANEPWPFEHETVFQSRAASYRSLVARPRPVSP